MILQRKVKSSKEISFWRQQFIDDGVMTALCIVGFAFFSWIGWHIDPFWFCVVTVAGVTCGFLIFRFRPRRQWVLQVLMLSTVVVMMFIGGNQVPRLRFLGINWMVGVYMGAAAISSWERFVRRRGLLNRTNYVLAPFGTKVRFVGLGEFAERVSGLNGGTRTVVSGIVGEARLDVAGDAKDRLVVWFSHSSG